jgi:hypothetical protein
MSRKRRIRVRKRNGGTEDFRIDKFRSSLLRSGADPGMVQIVLDEVMEKVGPRTTTQEIYRLAHARLKRKDDACGMRYTLKRALFRLGPTGYPFEKYIADVFEEYGYRTKVGITLEGKCVSHEVDVLAVSDSEVIAMECKYHNSRGTTTDVKVALYVHSRARDLEPTLTASYRGRKFSGRLVTNTRCTVDALDYARCAGLSVLSWRYPEGSGLEEMIESRRLYPVTMIYGMQAGLVQKLIESDILLLRDILALDSRILQSRLGLTPEKVRTLKERAKRLCG